MSPIHSNEEQVFLDNLDKKLWNAADRLRSNLDAAVYKHAVLGLIFLKYVSDSFDLRREELRRQFADPESDYYLDREDYDSDEDYEAAMQDELEDRDYFTEKNVFWVPALARWENIKNNATLSPGAEIEVKNGKTTTYVFRSVGRLIDDALEAVEKENPRLKGVLEKNRYSQLQLETSKLIGLISEVISSIPFYVPKHALTPASPNGRGAKQESLSTSKIPPSPSGRGAGGEGNVSLNSKDILGHVYEYFLGQFALAEGKKGGQYYTPKSIVSLIVEMLEPYKGKVYDPAMGSGGFFVQSESFIEKYGGKIGDISVYGQESNPTTWRLAAMNMAIRGIDFNFGKQPADTFTNDQHPDLRADFVMANPPFNIKEWWDGKLEGDPRWVYGTPPKSNANYAWLQHMLYHLAPTGSMALLLANGSMSSNTNGEGDIRKELVKADLVECIVALPGQLFTNTQIPACIWFLSKDKSGQQPSPQTPLPEGEGLKGLRDRRGEVLFLDARKLGYMKDRVLRDFTAEDSSQIIETFRNWRKHPPSTSKTLPSTSGRGVGGEGVGYQNIPGFCYSASIADIEKADFVLTPGRYVGAADAEDDGEPFADKMDRLTRQLNGQFSESKSLEDKIRANLGGLGFEL